MVKGWSAELGNQHKREAVGYRFESYPGYWVSFSSVHIRDRAIFISSQAKPN